MLLDEAMHGHDTLTTVASMDCLRTCILHHHRNEPMHHTPGISSKGGEVVGEEGEQPVGGGEEEGGAKESGGMSQCGGLWWWLQQRGMEVQCGLGGVNCSIHGVVAGNGGGSDVEGGEHAVTALAQLVKVVHARSNHARWEVYCLFVCVWI